MSVPVVVVGGLIAARGMFAYPWLVRRGYESFGDDHDHRTVRR